jgi:hypothetical protein
MFNIRNVHGHIHNCGSAKVSSNYSDPTSDDYVEPWLWRFCVPNMCANRYNEKYDTVWGEVDENGNKVQWVKESGTAKATSFNIISIDRKNKKIYAHIFGAGKDRAFSYDADYVEQEYSINVTANNCSGSSNNPTTITENGIVTMTFTANDGYKLPEDINVTGASYSWDKSTGVLTLSIPISDVSISISAVSSDLLNMMSRTHVPMSEANGDPQTIKATEPRELDGTKIYDACNDGRRGYYCSTKITEFKIISNSSLSFNVSSGSGYGPEFPIPNLKVGKTYTFTHETTVLGSNVYLMKYNSDTTFNSKEQLGKTAPGSYTSTITPEDGYIYSLLFTQISGTNTYALFTGVSLLEN